MILMFTRIRQFFRHYSKLDLINWFSIVMLMVLMLAAIRYSFGKLFAWGLLGGSLLWLAVLHNEISETVATWHKKRLELEQQGLSGRFLHFLRHSELELWGYWSVLLFTDWVGLFWGIIALGPIELEKFVLVPLFIISIAGIGASVIYFFLNLYRTAKLNQKLLS
jgi:hypothetical protein